MDEVCLMMLKKSFSQLVLRLSVLSCFVLGGFAAEAETDATSTVHRDPFPVIADGGSDLPDGALDRLSEHVQTLVDDEEIVGGELLVIQNRRTLLHKAFGWKDMEARIPAETDSVYCVRSMTKPLVGTAVQMLIDEGRLSLDTYVFEILPAFDRPKAREITVEHLLTHTGGLPFTTLTKPLTDYDGLREVAEQAAGSLESDPGSGFQYSDAGSDTLGAIVAQITGDTVEAFIQSRILDPLGMNESYTLIGDDAEVLARIPAAYSGGTGVWSTHWKPSQKPLFPFFLSSQSLYSTASDYARFLALWLDRGMVGETRLLSEEAVSRALMPANLMSNYPQTLDEARPFYGHQWLVHAAEGSKSPTIFGHNGSDGTYAWAWPAEDLMVLFFTQSRGNLAGLALEPLMHRLLVDKTIERKVEKAPSRSQGPSGAERMLDIPGLYWDETAESAYYVVRPRGKGLTLERPGRMLWVLKPHDAPDRFVHEALDNVWVEFQRDEQGRVVAMKTSFGGKIEMDPKHGVDGHDPSLPTVDEVVSRFQEVHGLEKLPELGLIRSTGSLNFKSRGMHGRVTSTFDADRQRTDVRFGSMTETELQMDGRVWSKSSATGTQELEGLRREMARVERLVVRFGDWREHHDHVEVLKRIRKDDRSVILVRVASDNLPSSTLIVDEQTGKLLIADTLSVIPGVGIVGVRTHYEDYRDVEGLSLPFRSTSKFSTDLIGIVEMKVSKMKVGVKEKARDFEMP